ncbi:MAG: class I SAM-dependent methyltransferase [Thermoplasmata archaeon]
MREGYYSARLSGERLKACYELAPPRVQRYLRAEIQFVRGFLDLKHTVVELGCGYGRVLRALIGHTGRVIGVDSSRQSLEMARSLLRFARNCDLLRMDAVHLGLASDSIDAVVCIQNGISAFHVDPAQLVRESLRVTRPGGRCLFSSYSDEFWEERLEWFRRQSAAGLLGNIDWDATGDGTIVCDDGFTATTLGREEFNALTADLGVESRVQEVDASSLFCVIRK